MRFFSRWKVCFFMLLALNIPAEATVIEASSMKEVQKAVEELIAGLSPDKVLVAADVDFTLLIPDHPAAQLPHYKKYKEALGKLFKELELTPEQIDQVLTLAIHSVPHKIGDTHAKELIGSLQARGIPVIVATALLAGPQPYLPVRPEVWRVEQLASLGFDFSGLIEEEEFVLNDIAPHANNQPVFYQGALLTNGEQGKHNKGSALGSFITRSGLQPQIVILIDDNKKHAEVIAQTMAQKHPNVTFYFILYTGLIDYAPIPISETDFLNFWRPLALRVKESLSSHS